MEIKINIKILKNKEQKNTEKTSTKPEQLLKTARNMLGGTNNND